MALSLDGSAHSGVISGAQSGTVTLTTTNSNDVIILVITTYQNQSISSVADGASLTWHLRKTLLASDGNATLWTYYAIAVSPLSSDVINVTWTSSTVFASIEAFGISGANTITPFDTNSGLPSTATGTSTTITTTFSTSNANDFIFAAVGDRGSNTYTASAGFTIIQQQSVTQSLATEYEIVSAGQSSASAGFTSDFAYGWILFVDAIQAASSAPTIFITPMLERDMAAMVAPEFIPV